MNLVCWFVLYDLDIRHLFTPFQLWPRYFSDMLRSKNKFSCNDKYVWLGLANSYPLIGIEAVFMGLL